MSITVKVFSGYKETYKKYYKDAVKLAYLKNGIVIKLLFRHSTSLARVAVPPSLTREGQ